MFIRTNAATCEANGQQFDWNRDKKLIAAYLKAAIAQR